MQYVCLLAFYFHLVCLVQCSNTIEETLFSLSFCIVRNSQHFILHVFSYSQCESYCRIQCFQYVVQGKENGYLMHFIL